MADVLTLLDGRPLTDHQLLTLTIWGEARGERVEGRIAVASVIRNRVQIDLGHDGKPDWWGEGYGGVILAPWQFSSWNQNDPNRDKMLALLSCQEVGGVGPSTDPVLPECSWIARGILGGQLLSRVGLCTHYYDKRIAAPAWEATAHLVDEIGHHRFYDQVK